ncbi:hypothetical protein BOTNAR_0652g00070 [Botryotinia narcissicola]|uniref:Uncharacterized protein n=1 Tax=Botryotinia narcissicola TaxID=278944 RepID=A0A4Z1H9B2_9HELO|nr:hypothetical protein BOTNAR_0652g00070 [Botryotinia narcissicola]
MSLPVIIKAFELPSGQRGFHKIYHALQNSHIPFRPVTSENAAAMNGPMARPRIINPQITGDIA